MSRAALRLDWALWGKRQSTRDDYAVLATSAGPFTPAQFESVITHNNPGNSPAAESGQDALPWVWFAQPTLKGVTYLGIGIRQWTNDTDRTGRRIAITRFFSLPVAEALDLGFADLYHTVKGIDLGWDVPEPFQGKQITAEPVISTEPQRLRLPTAAIAAAAVLENPVTLMGGGDLTLSQRLTALDGVANALPSGTRTWLSASTWSNVAGVFRLAFTDHKSADDTPVEVFGDVQPESGYGAEFVRMYHEHPNLLAYLKRRRDVTTPDTSLVGAALGEITLAADVVALASSGVVQGHHLRRLVQLGLFQEYSRAERQAVLASYLCEASPEDITQDEEILRTHWSGALDETLRERVAAAVGDARFPVAGLEPFARLALAVDSLDPFGQGLVPAGVVEDPSTVRAAEVVVELGKQEQWAAALSSVVVDSLPLSVHVGRFLLHGEPQEEHAALLRELDQIGAATAWQTVRMPFMEELTPSEPDLAALDSADGGALAVLLRKSEARPDRLRQVMSALLPLAHERVRQGGVPTWWAPVRACELEPAQAAYRDVIDLLAGEQVEFGNTPAYRAALVEFGVTERGLVAAAVTGQVERDWDLLDVLWDLLHEGVEEPDVPEAVVTALADAVLADEQRYETMRRWDGYLRRDERVDAWRTLVELTAETEVSTVVDLLVVWCTRRWPTNTAVRSVVASAWEPSAVQWLELAQAVANRTEGSVELPRALLTAHESTAELVEPLARALSLITGALRDLSAEPAVRQALPRLAGSRDDLDHLARQSDHSFWRMPRFRGGGQ
ncbi:hypothetical protein [Actinokineospora cianjurensis]|uniref:Uncharacterized protein n=1 Tax=Actinokineospora cianjurensis TaxID=585224 RepID=A0A421AXK3_9PSEU|nr:hypothetical protein [Actinokineospora cianjurensis]RLK54575.1 hypothetical protein CLV68_5608 [Actinokineospora cianjurensis]